MKKFYVLSVLATIAFFFYFWSLSDVGIDKIPLSELPFGIEKVWIIAFIFVSSIVFGFFPVGVMKIFGQKRK